MAKEPIDLRLRRGRAERLRSNPSTIVRKQRLDVCVNRGERLVFEALAERLHHPNLAPMIRDLLLRAARAERIDVEALLCEGRRLERVAFEAEQRAVERSRARGRSSAAAPRAK